MPAQVLFYKKPLYKQPSTRQPNIQETFKTTRKELRNFRQIANKTIPKQCDYGISFFSRFRATVHAEARLGTPSLTSLPKVGGMSGFIRSSGRSPIQFLTIHSHA